MPSHVTPTFKFDKDAEAGYLYFTDPVARDTKIAKTYMAYGMNIDVDEFDNVLGIELLHVW